MKTVPGWTLPPLLARYPAHNLPVVIFDEWEPGGTLQYAREDPFESLYWVSDPGSGPAIWGTPFDWPFRVGYRPTLEDWMELGLRPISLWPRQVRSKEDAETAYAVTEMLYRDRLAPGGAA